MMQQFRYEPIEGQVDLDVAETVVHFLNQALVSLQSGDAVSTAENLSSMGFELKPLDFLSNEKNKIQSLAVCGRAALLGLQMSLLISKEHVHENIKKNIDKIIPLVEMLEFKLACVKGISECEKKIREKNESEAKNNKANSPEI